MFDFDKVKIKCDFIRRKLNLSSRSVKVFHFIVIIIALYFIISPFFSEMDYQVRRTFDIKYAEEKYFGSDKEDEEIDISDNRLIIPEIGVNIEIVEGDSDAVLARGAWRRPNTGTPDKGGNVVITGHRFQYLPPNNKTFYNLNKLSESSKIFIYWEGERYIYKVYETFIVEPYEIDIENHLEGNILTLYTCHPLWTADKRLVVRAEEVSP